MLFLEIIGGIIGAALLIGGAVAAVWFLTTSRGA